MKPLTEHFIENLIITLILSALTLAGAYFLREKVNQVMNDLRDAPRKIQVRL